MGLVGVTMADIAGQHNFLFFVREPSQTQLAILPSTVGSKQPPVFIQSWYITRLAFTKAEPQHRQTCTQLKGRTRVPMLHSQDLRGPRCTHHMGIKLHLLLGESVLTEMLKE